METQKKGFIFNTKWALSSGVVFLATVLVLSEIGFIPEAAKTEASESEKVVPVVLIADETPDRIRIDKIGVNVAVENPSETGIAALDAALLKGVVRYPGSADLEETGTMFLFGHSTSHAVVINQNYKAFNNLGALVKGDLVRVQSSSTENVYRVTSVRFAKDSEVDVPLEGRTKKLVLSTCDSFGEKSDRIVVEAEFVGSFSL